MFVRKQYSPATHKKASDAAFGPAFHHVERMSKYSKQVSTRCGLQYVVADIESKEKLDGDKFCTTCDKLLKGHSLRCWSSTGYAKNN